MAADEREVGVEEPRSRISTKSGRMSITTGNMLITRNCVRSTCRPRKRKRERRRRLARPTSAQRHGADGDDQAVAQVLAKLVRCRSSMWLMRVSVSGQSTIGDRIRSRSGRIEHSSIQEPGRMANARKARMGSSVPSRRVTRAASSRPASATHTR